VKSFDRATTFAAPTSVPSSSGHPTRSEAQKESCRAIDRSALDSSRRYVFIPRQTEEPFVHFYRNRIPDEGIIIGASADR